MPTETLYRQCQLERHCHHEGFRTEVHHQTTWLPEVYAQVGRHLLLHHRSWTVTRVGTDRRTAEHLTLDRQRFASIEGE